jgi:hypothetical protein
LNVIENNRKKAKAAENDVEKALDQLDRKYYRLLDNNKELCAKFAKKPHEFKLHK